MFAPTKLVVLLTAALSVVALPSHVARNPHLHREIAARVAQPAQPVVVAREPVVVARDMAVPAKRLLRKKRSGNGRCKPGNSSVPPSSTGAPPDEPTTTPKENVVQTEQPNATPQPDSATPGPDPSTPSSDPAAYPDPATPNPDPATPTPAPAPTPTPASTPDSGNGGGQTYSGQGTFYATGLGACGITNNDGDMIAAVSHELFDSFPGSNGNPNQNPICNKTARVTFQGKTIDIKLTDRCEGCQFGDLDFSPTAFNMLSDPSAGRISGITWVIVG